MASAWPGVKLGLTLAATTYTMSTTGPRVDLYSALATGSCLRAAARNARTGGHAISAAHIALAHSSSRASRCCARCLMVRAGARAGRMVAVPPAAATSAKSSGPIRRPLWMNLTLEGFTSNSLQRRLRGCMPAGTSTVTRTLPSCSFRKGRAVSGTAVVLHAVMARRQTGQDWDALPCSPVTALCSTVQMQRPQKAWLQLVMYMSLHVSLQMAQTSMSSSAMAPNFVS
mmetsp:Transcript_8448/g.21131  ORF Transcript_8448/g.21131 Transcript_8448/m.21131 type:complete len:228 (-) Transcript_8448:51-734(-)